ncbi:MAG: DNA alkylation repair protein, partial [Syntrophobacteraceae bacterium]
MWNDIINTIRSELRQNSQPESISGCSRYFKEEIKCYGVKTTIVGKLSRSCFAELKGRSKAEIFALCEELFKSGYNEEAWIACDWAYRMRKEYQQADFEIFENWVNGYIDNWAKCDTFCNHTVGEFIETYPEFIQRLKQWTSSENRWLRRGAAVSLIIPARHGKFL